MGLLSPTPPPYDALDWVKRPLAERGRMVCEAWAMQGYGTPVSVFAFYALKIALYLGAWLFFCSLSPTLGAPSAVASWWLAPLAFQKAILWSLLFEVLGLGCGSGPLSGRYLPPFGGFLYFLRPGTTKLPLFPGAPLIGGRTRSALDALLYLALLVLCVRALLAPNPGAQDYLPIALLVPALGVLDKTLFLAARAEHYWVMLVCFVAAPGNWIPGAMAVQLALWFWAGFSKLNHHFPTVVAVMNSNGPITRFAWMRRLMYRAYPSDLRPSALATFMGHAGTGLEMGVTFAFLLTPLGTPPVVALTLMVLLHAYILSNVPMGVPLEWNFSVPYGGFVLFWAHPEVSFTSVTPPLLAAFLLTMLVLVPLVGNLWPRRVSFLLSMRYYAGNWPWSVWLFRGDAYRKLEKLTTSSRWVYDQLALLYDKKTSVGLVGKVVAFRMMHLHGRALPLLIPKAVDNLAEHEWLDGEIVAGLALGWNFGDGHLHQEQLLAAIQAQCGFTEGELRCIFVESQPLGQSTLDYRVVDAASGVRAAGKLEIAELRSRQPWEAAAPAP